MQIRRRRRRRRTNLEAIFIFYAPSFRLLWHGTVVTWWWWNLLLLVYHFVHNIPANLEGLKIFINCGTNAWAKTTYLKIPNFPLRMTFYAIVVSGTLMMWNGWGRVKFCGSKSLYWSATEMRALTSEPGTIFWPYYCKYTYFALYFQPWFVVCAGL